LINTQDSTLKITENADIPQFLSYNPSAIKAEQNSRSINVRDIPLFIKESEVRSHFRKFGFIESFHMSIRRGSLFQFAYITFEDSDHVTQFHELIWSTILKGNFLRIYPASLNIEQQNARKQYTIVLRNLPQNTKGSDLINIVNDTNAKSISILIHQKSLKSKTWAYFAFKDETIMNNARDTIRTLKDNQLVWDTTDNVKNFCVKCSSPLHKPDQCDAFSFRGRKPISQHIMDKYKKFGHNPRFVQAERGRSSNNNVSRKNLSSSRSRSRNNTRDNSAQPNKRVSYAEATIGSSISSRTQGSTQNNKGKAPMHPIIPPPNNENNRENHTFRILQTKLDLAIKKYENMAVTLTKWELFYKKVDQRLTRLEKAANIPTSSQQIPSLSPASNNNTSNISRPSGQPTQPTSPKSSTSASTANTLTSPDVQQLINIDESPDTVPTVAEFNNMKGEINSLGSALNDIKALLINSRQNTCLSQ
jgi:hypothetical protein